MFTFKFAVRFCMASTLLMLPAGSPDLAHLPQCLMYVSFVVLLKFSYVLNNWYCHSFKFDYMHNLFILYYKCTVCVLLLAKSFIVNVMPDAILHSGYS